MSSELPRRPIQIELSAPTTARSARRPPKPRISLERRPSMDERLCAGPVPYPRRDVQLTGEEVFIDGAQRCGGAPPGEAPLRFATTVAGRHCNLQGPARAPLEVLAAPP